MPGLGWNSSGIHSILLPRGLQQGVPQLLVNYHIQIAFFLGAVGAQAPILGLWHLPPAAMNVGY